MPGLSVTRTTRPCPRRAPPSRPTSACAAPRRARTAGAPRPGRLERRGARAAACLGQRRTQHRARPYSQLLAQPGSHVPPDDQGTGPVTGRGELPRQVRMRGLVQRVQFAAPPRPPRRTRGVTIPFGRGGPGFQRLGQFGSQLPPRGLGPVSAYSGSSSLWHSVAAAARSPVAARRRQSARSTMTASGRGPTVVREAVAPSSPIALRSAHTAVRRFARAAAPALPGHRCAATASRSWGAWRTARKAGRRPAGSSSESCSPSRSAATAPSSRTWSTPLLYPPLTLRFARLSGLLTLR